MKIEDSEAGIVARFKMHAQPNLAETKKQKRPIFDDIEVCEIRFAANKQTVGVYPANEIKEFITDPVSGEKTPITYAMKFNNEYLAFKNGDAQASSGTPLEALDFLTPGKRLELKALHIHTAEALAGLDGTPLKQLGMGGRNLKDAAQAYLDQAQNNDADAMAGIVAEQDARIAELQAQLAALTKDPLDHDGDGRKGGVKKADDDKPASAFSDFEDEDIKNWLADAAPDLKIDGRWSRETLIEKADEVNAALAKKNQKAVA